MDNSDPRKICERIKNGDKASFELFYRLEYNNIVHFISSYSIDKEQAEDLAQEVFCSLWEHRSLLDPDGNIRSYLYTSARNKAINILKAAAYSGRAGSEEALAAISDDSLTEMIEALELEDLIRKAFETLPESSRKSFEMSRLQGMKNREIADTLGYSLKAIEYHIRISLRHFRTKIKDFI